MQAQLHTSSTRREAAGAAGDEERVLQGGDPTTVCKERGSTAAGARHGYIQLRKLGSIQLTDVNEQQECGTPPTIPIDTPFPVPTSKPEQSFMYPFGYSDHQQGGVSSSSPHSSRSSASVSSGVAGSSISTATTQYTPAGIGTPHASDTEKCDHGDDGDDVKDCMGTAAQVEAEGMAIAWMKGLAASGGLPHGLQALVRVEPPGCATLRHSCSTCAQASLITWDASAGTFRASSLPLTPAAGAAHPLPYLSSVLPAAVLVPAGGHGSRGLVVQDGGMHQTDSASNSVLPYPAAPGCSDHSRDHRPRFQVVERSSEGNQCHRVTVEVQVQHLHPEMLHSLAALVPSALCEASTAAMNRADDLLSAALGPAYKLGVLLGGSWLPCTVEGTANGGPLITSGGGLLLGSPSMMVKVTAELPAGWHLSGERTLWIHLVQERGTDHGSSSLLLLSSFPVLLFQDPGPMPGPAETCTSRCPASGTSAVQPTPQSADVAAVAEINQWVKAVMAGGSGAAGYTVQGSPRGAGTPVHLMRRAASVPLASAYDVQLTPFEQGFKQPSVVPLVHVQLQQPHPLHGFLSVTLPLARGSCASTPRGGQTDMQAQAGVTHLTSCLQRQLSLKAGKQHQGKGLNSLGSQQLDEDIETFSSPRAQVLEFLTELGSWRTYAAQSVLLLHSLSLQSSQQHSPPDTHTPGIAEAALLPAAIAGGHMSAWEAAGIAWPGLPGWEVELAHRLRMVLRGLALLRRAVQAGMRGLGTTTHAELAMQPLHYPALAVLASVTAAAGEAAQEVEANISRLLSTTPQQQLPIELGALIPEPSLAEGLICPPPPLVDSGGRTLLHLAVLSGRAAMVSDVIAWGEGSGASFVGVGTWTSQDASGYSPLQLAALLSDGGALAADLLARFPEVRVLWHMCVGTEGLAPEQLLMSTQQQQRARRRITTQFSLPC